MTKRLENSQFRWPPIEDGMMKLSAVQLSALLEGGQWASAAVEQPSGVLAAFGSEAPRLCSAGEDFSVITGQHSVEMHDD